MQPSAENTRHRCERAVHGCYNPDKDCVYRLPHTHQADTPTRLRCNNNEHGVVRYTHCVPMTLDEVKVWHDGNAHRTWPVVSVIRRWLFAISHTPK